MGKASADGKRRIHRGVRVCSGRIKLSRRLTTQPLGVGWIIETASRKKDSGKWAQESKHGFPSSA